MKKKVFFVLTLSLLLVMFFYCDKKNPVSNKAPVISSISATATNLDWGQIITLIANAEDPDGEELTFSWTSSGGSFTTDANKDTVSWQAPNASGSYTCTVEVSDGEDKTTKNIVLTVEEHPVLSTNADTLYFTTDLTSLSFDVTNTGTGVLDWSFTTTTDGGGSWITSASPSSGSLATGEVNAVSVGINRSGLSGGKYYGWINITSDDGSKNIRIIVDVASISVSPASLDFGEASTSMNLSMENGGAGTLTWTVTDDKDWLSVSPASGSTTTESDNIQVSVSRGGLSSGTYTGTITISEATTSNTATVSVSMQVTNPVLSVTPTSLDFGTASTAKSVSITNVGGGTLNWTVYDNSSWLSVSPSSGSTTSETDYVTVNVSRSGLAPGTYNGIVTVNSNGGTETISVTMDVPQPQGQWISYDDGSYEDILDAQPAWWYFFVQFDRPSGWTNFKVTKVKIKFSTSGSDGIKLLCYNTQYSSGYYLPYQKEYESTSLDPVSGWNEWSVDWALNDSRFCAGYFQLQSYAPDLYYDTSSPSMRSSLVYYENYQLKLALFNDVDWAIRVYVEQSGAASPATPNGMWLEGTVTREDMLIKGFNPDKPVKIIKEIKKLKDVIK